MAKKYKWWALYIIALLVCVVVIYAVPSVAGLLERTYITEPGEIVRSSEVEGYIVRNETVYKSDRAGTVNRLIDSGKLVKGGSRVVEITGSGRDNPPASLGNAMSALGKSAKTAGGGYSYNAGYISYAVDGAESRLSSDSLDKLTEDDCRKYAAARLCELDGKKCSKGEPVFKTTRNGEWWIVFFTDKSSSKLYEEGAQVSFDINGESANAYVKSVTKVKGEESYKIILKCNVFVKGYLELRSADVKVTTESARGLIIEKKSIVTKNKQKGVLVKNKLGENVFKPVYIKADDGEKCAVCEDYYMDEKGNFVETLKVYDEILKRPSKNDVKESK